MGLDLWVLYLICVCGCLFHLSFISNDKNKYAVVLRVITSLGIPFTMIASIVAFGTLVRWLS